MFTSRVSLYGPSIRMLLSAVSLTVAATVLSPQLSEAQCAGCGYDYQEGTIECASLPVGVAFCVAGENYVPPANDDDEGTWVSWCYSGGAQCEWIMQLDFGEDGTAYAQRDPLRAEDAAWLVDSSVAGVRSATCDGVVLGLGPVDGETARSDAPLNMEL